LYAWQRQFFLSLRNITWRVEAAHKINSTSEVSRKLVRLMHVTATPRGLSRQCEIWYQYGVDTGGSVYVK